MREFQWFSIRAVYYSFFSLIFSSAGIIIGFPVLSFFLRATAGNEVGTMLFTIFFPYAVYFWIFVITIIIIALFFVFIGGKYRLEKDGITLKTWSSQIFIPFEKIKECHTIKEPIAGYFGLRFAEIRLREPVKLFSFTTIYLLIVNFFSSFLIGVGLLFLFNPKFWFRWHSQLRQEIILFTKKEDAEEIKALLALKIIGLEELTKKYASVDISQTSWKYIEIILIAAIIFIFFILFLRTSS